MAQVPEAVLKRIPERARVGSGVGPGWFRLLSDLDQSIAACIPDYEVAQCKEKFGALRYYVSFPEGTPEVEITRARALISEAEAISARTCETCGAPGKIRGEGWVGAACEEHAS